MSQGTVILVLNSKDRLAHSVSSTDCIFQFTPFACTSVEPISLMMPMSSYNINSTNNRVYFNDGVVRNFTLTNGNYDIYSFLTELETKFNSVSADYVVTYSDVDMKITITGLLPFRLLFGTYTTNSCAYIMGFNRVDGVLAFSQTSNNCIDLSLPLYFNCIIQELNSNIQSSSGVDHCNFIFPNSVNGADLAIYNEMSHYKQCSKVNEINVQCLHVRFSVNGNVDLDINNNDWVMLLRLHYC